MKKLLKFSLLLTLACVVLCACKDDDDSNSVPPVDYSILPARAQNFVQQHFGVSAYREITEIKSENNIVGYLVNLADNVQIEFDREGTWQIVASGGKTLPGSILLQYIPAIAIYVEDNYPNKGVIRYDRKFYGMKIRLEDYTELSFVLDGEFLGNNREISDLPGNARQLLDTHFTNGEDLNIFETTTGDKKIYTAQYIDGNQIRFDENGNWLTVKSANDTTLLPQSVVAILPENTQQLLTSYDFGDVIQILRNDATSNINVNYAYKTENDVWEKPGLKFDSDGNWLSLEDYASGLPAEITDILQDNIRDFLALYFPDKTDVAALAKGTQLFGQDMVDIVSVSYLNGDKYTFYADGSWLQLDGILPTTITAILPDKIQQFVTTYYPTTKIIRIAKEARVNTTENTVAYYTRVLFQNNNYATFYAEDDEWENIAGTAVTNSIPDAFLALLPADSQLYLSINFSDKTLTRVGKETVSINFGTTEEPDIQKFPVYRVTYTDNTWLRFNTAGDWRTVNAKDNATPLPESVKVPLPADLIARITLAGYDINTAGIQYLNKITETFYEVRFIVDGTLSPVIKFDLLADPSNP
jgi:hypothetical protein